MTAPFEPPHGWRVAGGEMAERVSDFDWSQTPLGPRDAWSMSLTGATEMVLASGFAMALRWGPDFVLIYNAAYAPILGEKHPWALGRSAREVWAEVWGEIEPAHLAILAGREASVFTSDFLLRIQRHGSAWDDARFSLSYSPVEDPDSPTGVGGVFVVAVEMTEQINTTAALSASEERYALALAVGIGTWDWDIPGGTITGNATFADIYRVDRALALAGFKIEVLNERIHPDDLALLEDKFNASVETGQSLVFEHRLLRRDGSIAWVLMRGQCHYDGDGKAVRLIGVSFDVTERRAAQDELARSEAEFRAFSQAMPNHAWAASPDGDVDWINDRLKDYTGLSLGNTVEEWAKTVHPKDRRRARQYWTTARASGGPYELEVRLKRRDGAYRWHLARAVPIRGTGGEIVRWIGTDTDTHDQKIAIARLAQLNAKLEKRVAEQAAERDRLWNVSRDLLAVTDAQGIHRAVNPAWTSMLGWRSDEVIGRHHLDFVHPDDKARGGRALERARAKDQRPHTNRTLCKDGGFRWISWVGAPSEGLIYCTGRDITEEKEAAEALEAAQEALRQSQKMDAVGQLTGGIAHDFNNMLAVVVGSLDLLAKRLPSGDERAERYLDGAADGARRAAQLTQRLLAFSRQQPLNPESLNANALVAGMSELLRHSIGVDIKFQTLLAKDLWLTHADSNQLENVVLNLALNARDAMPEGGRLTIETQNFAIGEQPAAKHFGMAPGDYVLIAVTDTGSGMPQDVIDRAFDPFFTTKPVGKGTGLGLSQVYGFVSQSGGDVKIYSELGQGTTIKIYLPRLQGAAMDTAALAASNAPVAALPGKLILVVEDDPSVRRFSVDAVESLGYRVLEADGARAALAHISAHPEIDLMFTDVVMPEVNGAKLAEEARRLRPDLKVLFTTGYTRDAVVHNGVLDPGVELIGKPFTVAALSAKLQAVLRA